VSLPESFSSRTRTAKTIVASPRGPNQPMKNRDFHPVVADPTLALGKSQHQGGQPSQRKADDQPDADLFDDHPGDMRQGSTLDLGADRLRSDNKRRARLNVLTHILSKIPYEELPRSKVKLPKRQERGDYKESDYPFRRIPEVF
jgi:hypothetical protein